MDTDTAHSVSPNPRTTQALEYLSYATPLLAAALAFMGEVVSAVIMLGVAVLLYQLSQYRKTIETVRKGSHTD